SNTYVDMGMVIVAYVIDVEIGVGVDIGGRLDVIGNDVEGMDGEVGVIRIDVGAVVVDIFDVYMIGEEIGVDVDGVVGMGETFEIDVGTMDKEVIGVGDG
ncbi:hypothetical protein KI387_029781, partial [Taxus chinensis]